MIHPLKQKLAKGFENSAILSCIRRLLSSMLACQFKVYGLFLFSFAVYSAIVYVFKIFLIDDVPTIDAGTIVTLVLTVIASVGMISSRHTLAGALLQSSSASFFLFDVAGLRRETFDNAGEREGRVQHRVYLGYAPRHFVLFHRAAVDIDRAGRAYRRPTSCCAAPSSAY